ncbi:MAG: GHMP kinase [Candidatus Lokiarchaeota archaeon]|nr:GHMP kinase [Candidatus Lokiarchaeota archaeon]
MDYQAFFGEGRKIARVEAPGRLDVMGGIADYSGSLVLEMPVDKGTTAHVAPRQDDTLRVHSTSAGAMGKEGTVTARFGDFLDAKGQVNYGIARSKLAGTPGSDWAAYVIGCLLVLAEEKGARVRGMDAWIESTLPSGRGVSASAALEVSTMAALSRAIGIELGDTELPILCQRVENLVVGAPCGLMDQLTSYLGKRNRLLPILCQPADVQASIPIPDGVRFVGVDSGAEHSVGGSGYTNVRVAAFMGYTIIARAEGASIDALRSARNARDWSGLPYHGYLANVPVPTFEEGLEPLLPDRMTGKDFTARFGTTIDTVTEIRPDVEYAVKVCTRHPVMESARVQVFSRIISGLNADKQRSRTERAASLKRLGGLMVESHRSYGACGLGHPATDAIVDAVLEAGPGKDLFGAKITGGGSGGTVCILCDGDEGFRAAMEIASVHWAARNKEPVVFTGSQDGARFA